MKHLCNVEDNLGVVYAVLFSQCDGRTLYEIRFPHNATRYFRVGGAQIMEGSNAIQGVEIVRHLRRRGIASRLYDTVEKHFDFELVPSEHLTDDGKAFWNNRRKQCT